MEFLNNHSEITKKEFEKIKKFSIDSFQNFHIEKRKFNYALENTRTFINETFSATSELKKFITIDSYSIYEKYLFFLKDYDDNITYNEKCELVLKNDMFAYFNSFNEAQNPNNITFENFVVFLLKYVASRIIIYRLEKNSELYKLFYENNYYENFILDDFEGNVVNSKVYIDYFKKFNKGKAPNISVEKAKQVTLPNEVVNDYNFSNTESCLLIYLFISIMKKNDFDTDAEIYKVLSLIKIKPSHEFENKNSYRSSIEYKAISGKVINIDLDNLSTNNKFQLKELNNCLDKLKLKIKPLNLKKINKKIKEIQSIDSTRTS